MFIPESAYSSAEFPSAAKTVFVAEITCLLCSRPVGIAIDSRWPPVSTVLIRLSGSKVLRRMALHQLRCGECGGNTAPTEVTERLIRRERPIDWQSEQPPRGRPPKWLVAQRAAARLREHRRV